jgi:MoaA/NifB/PqqE/SkfB family radical SAM enzyme
MVGTFKEQIFSDELFKDFEEDLALSVTMELTHKCNYRCVHCYGSSERAMQDLSYSQITSIIDQLFEHGTLDMSFTGGEPLLRPDFCDLYKYARNKGMFVSVLTNASLLANEHVDVLVEYPVSHLSITMYGYTKDTYERMTGVVGSHERFMTAINLLKKNQIPFELKSVATTINKHEMFKMRDYAASLGAPFRYSTKLIPENNGCRECLNYVLTPEEALWFDVNDKKKHEAWEYAAESPPSDHEYKDARKERQLRFLCHAGDKDVTISADGQLRLCLNERRSGYDLLNGSISEGYETYIKAARDELAPAGYKCLTCPDIKYCDQCAAEIGLIDGFEYGTQPTCVLARLRHEWLLGKETAATNKRAV